MAIIPDAIGQNLPAPQAPAGVATIQDRGASAMISGAANEIQAAFQEEQKRIDHAKTEDAFNQLRNAQLDLTIGEQNGFMNIKGGDAIKQPLLKNYTERFNTISSNLINGLDNDTQREMFRQRVNVAQSQFSGDLLKHIYQENNVYQKDVTKATIDTEYRMASSKWDSPAEVQASLSRIGAAVDQEAGRSGLPPEMAADMKLQQYAKVHDTVIRQALASKNYDYAKSWFDANRDQIDPTTARVLEKEVENASQKQAFNGYQSQFLSSMNSQAGLSSLNEAVTKDQNLDDDRKNILIGRIQNQQQTLQLRAERAQDRKERMLEHQISTINSMTLQGYEPTAEQIEPLVSAAKGTALEGNVRQMITTANATRQFRNMPFREQEAAISQMEVAARQDPTKFDVTAVARFKQIHEAQKKEVASDPVTFSVRQGLVDPRDPAVQPLDLTNPDSLATQLPARFGLARSVSSKYQSPVLPLTKEEATTLTNALKTAPPKEKATYFGQLAKASGADLNGYKAIMGQIAPDDPVTAIAGTFAGRGYIDPTQKAQTSVADLILRGQSILRPNHKEDGTPDKGKLWPMPQGRDQATMHQLFSDGVQDAYAGMPKAQTDLYQTAQAIYAAKVSDKGDATGILDADLWKQSIKLATGGVEKWNGKSVPLPWGMKYGDFKDELKSRVHVIASSGNLNSGVTNDKLLDMPLQAVGDGKYVFRSGDGVLIDKNSRPVVVDFNGPITPPSDLARQIPR